MKKVIVLLLLIASCGTAWGMTYPEIGRCNGENIRLREFPGPKGRIAGYVHTGMELVVLGETTVSGQKWYKVDHPMRKGNVWIPAQYIISSGSETEEIFVLVRHMLGINPEKTRALLGSPTHTERNILEYPGIKLWYDIGGLQRAEVSRHDYSFGGVNVGDSSDKLSALGMPKGWDKGRESWTLKGAAGEEITFRFNSNRITSMNWERPEKVKNR